MSLPVSVRTLFALLFSICAGLLAYAYYAQFVLLLNPCPMCIFQRIAFIVLGAVALLAAIHGPGRRGSLIYGGICLVAALSGAGLAGWHVWLQSQPPDMTAACGAMSLDYMLQIMSFQDALLRAFQGTGDCAEVSWRFLGLSMPAWTLIWFVGIAIGIVVALALDPRRAARASTG